MIKDLQLKVTSTQREIESLTQKSEIILASVGTLTSYGTKVKVQQFQEVQPQLRSDQATASAQSNADVPIIGDSHIKRINNKWLLKKEQRDVQSKDAPNLEATLKVIRETD